MSENPLPDNRPAPSRQSKAAAPMIARKRAEDLPARLIIFRRDDY